MHMIARGPGFEYRSGPLACRLGGVPFGLSRSMLNIHLKILPLELIAPPNTEGSVSKSSAGCRAPSRIFCTIQICHICHFDDAVLIGKLRNSQVETRLGNCRAATQRGVNSVLTSSDQ